MQFKDIQFYDGVSEYFDKMKKTISLYKRVYLFGAARGGAKAVRYFKEWGIEDNIIKVVDNDESKWGEDFYGKQIISVPELNNYMKEEKESVVVIASGSAHIIKDQLMSLGIPEKRLIIFTITMLNLNPTPYEYFSNQKEQIKKDIDMVYDQKSKDVFISLLNYKMTMKSKWLEEISDNEHDQYFDEIMNIGRDESFVDCGAYTGDTLDEFYLKYKKWNNYYCFEADKNVYGELVNHIRACNYYNVTVYDKAVWNRKQELNFVKTGGGSSEVAFEKRKNVVTVQADTISDILGDKDVTIIKMDVEGAERQALEGAKAIISKQRPKLAISIYHSYEDFIYLPEFIKSLNIDYKIYIRHYRKMSDSETICYAV